jgi:hypothetical protein
MCSVFPNYQCISYNVLCNRNEIANVSTMLLGEAFAPTYLSWKGTNNFHFIVCVDVAVSSIKVSNVTMEMRQWVHFTL